MISPQRLAEYDQELALADAGLDELVATHRRAMAGLGDFTSMGGLVLVYRHKMKPSGREALFLAAIRRLAMLAADLPTDAAS
jgi:hypothetical protein